MKTEFLFVSFFFLLLFFFGGGVGGGRGGWVSKLIESTIVARVVWLSALGATQQSACKFDCSIFIVIVGFAT